MSKKPPETTPESPGIEKRGKIGGKGRKPRRSERKQEKRGSIEAGSEAVKGRGLRSIEESRLPGLQEGEAVKTGGNIGSGEDRSSPGFQQARRASRIETRKPPEGGSLLTEESVYCFGGEFFKLLAKDRSSFSAFVFSGFFPSRSLLKREKPARESSSRKKKLASSESPE